MRIVLAQQNYHIGNIAYNTAKIIKAIESAAAEQADMIIFPELAICGYPPRDILYFEAFLEQCRDSISRLLPYSGNIGILVGCPSPNPVPEGKALHNSAYFLYEGAIQQVIHKTLLPTYDVFDEYRYFEPATVHEILHFKGKKIAVTICEDIWDIEPDPMYNYAPLDRLSEQAPDFIVNLSASPFNYNHELNRKVVLKHNTRKYGLPLLYCNCTGSQTEIIFDGGSLVFDRQGNQLLELPQFEEALATVTIDDANNIALPVEIPDGEIPDELYTPFTLQPGYNIGNIHKALVYGIREYFTKMGFRKALVASSGGIDSAVTLALACEALGPENVHALLLPSQYSSDHSVTDAVQLSENLGNPYDILSVKDIYFSVADTLAPIFKDLAADVTEENIQSRIRGLLSMALCNKFNYILLNTSNKSELSTGYGTLYGDMAGGLGVLGDLYKQQVYALARYINTTRDIIPVHIIEKAPSAELRPDQKDTDSLPEYEILDNILYQYIDRFRGTDDIVRNGYDEALVRKTLRMVNQNEYKRNQFCPVIRVSSKAFGPGRRIPIVSQFTV
ncbi:MAG: NAD+ synthase [Bacteroidetes bacterium 47-18]|nr:MAG: NAD+ synthase [Bacteroidetes bacterium 47-18]